MTYTNPGDLSVSPRFKLPTYQPDRLCHILLGDYAAVAEAINRMEVLRYCQRIAWVEPYPHRAQRRVHQRHDPPNYTFRVENKRKCKHRVGTGSLLILVTLDRNIFCRSAIAAYRYKQVALIIRRMRNRDSVTHQLRPRGALGYCHNAPYN
jgi:hypothetical protein